MSVSHGKNGKFKVGANFAGDQQNWSLDESIDDDDSTSMGDTAKTHLVGIPEWSGKADFLYDPADTGQAALTIGASVVLMFYTDGDATGKVYKTGTASVTGIGITVNKGNVNSTSISFKGNGALTSGTVGS